MSLPWEKLLIQAVQFLLFGIQKRIDTESISYVVLALSGEIQLYCNIKEEMAKSQNNCILQQYLKQGYSVPMAEALIRECYHYDS